MSDSIYFTKNSELSSDNRLVMLSNLGNVKLTLLKDNRRYTEAWLTSEVGGSRVLVKIELPENDFFKGINKNDIEAINDLLKQCSSLANHGLLACDQASESFNYSIKRV
jgi:hypothetical protein